MRKMIVVGVTSLLTCLAVHGYDATVARRYLKLYSQCDGQQIGKALFKMNAEALVAKIKAGEDIVVLDVRTKAEERIIGVKLPGSLHVPMNRVFAESTLSKLPNDRRILVVCQSGERSSIVAMGLRDIGFDRVFVLKGGLTGLLELLSPKKAGCAEEAK